MAFLTGNTVSLDNTGMFVPLKAAASLPSNPTQGQVIYNTDNHRMEIYDTGIWKDAADIRHGTFLTRVVITTGYVMGGYKDSSPWKNVNRMVHATDVMTNLGDLLTTAGAYTSGVNNLSKGFYGVQITVGLAQVPPLRHFTWQLKPMLDKIQIGT